MPCLRSLHGRMEASPARTLLHRILKDELRHAQIGWAYLGEQASQRDCSFVAEHLHEMLDRAVREAALQPAPDESSQALLSHGILPSAQRQEHFCSTLDTVIVPGFAHFGIDTTAMTGWRDEKLQAVSIAKYKNLPLIEK